MIDVSEKVFSTLKTKLISEMPKETPYGQSGIGFDTNNIVDYISSSYTPKTPYDFVAFAMNDNSQIGLTIDNAKETHQIANYVVEIYSKNVTNSATDKQAIKARAKSISHLVSDTMNDMGFVRSNGIEDSNHQDTGIYRISMVFTREIGKDDNINK